jgi:hypothetical protein
LRLPEELAERASREADSLGISFSDFVIHALDKALGGEGDSSILFLKNLAAWTEKTFDKSAFPEDVTLRVFHHVRDDAALKKEYDELVAGTDSEPSRVRITSLHRRVGLMVKRVLHAEVRGRSLPLDAREHLIQSHALLTPGEKKA